MNLLKEIILQENISPLKFEETIIIVWLRYISNQMQNI